MSPATRAKRLSGYKLPAAENNGVTELEHLHPTVGGHWLSFSQAYYYLAGWLAGFAHRQLSLDELPVETSRT